ncbi:DUF3043 domain-containing protein [Curtobacterium sp. RRHDQ10]|uniref:DUF3043 domain-containing protein n=1 Tax=Curtobacterium phyllosphaerae TaxID=3413379 RepID=UPI003BF4C8A9
MAKAAPKTDVSVNPSDESMLNGVPVGKGRPTPTRKEREAANRRPLVGNSPQDRKAARSRLTAEREKARIGMAAGEERYLPAKDRGEQRRYIRDFVDARWNVGEVLVPIMVIVVLLTFVQSSVQSAGLLVIWAFFALLVIDCLIAGFMVNRRIKKKWGEAAPQRGNLFYVATRAAQMRFLRLPKPQVKRGHYPE